MSRQHKYTSPSKKALERAVFSFAAVVIVAALWFWSRQVGDVIDLLRLAYG